MSEEKTGNGEKVIAIVRNWLLIATASIALLTLVLQAPIAEKLENKFFGKSEGEALAMNVKKNTEVIDQIKNDISDIKTNVAIIATRLEVKEKGK